MPDAHRVSAGSATCDHPVPGSDPLRSVATAAAAEVRDRIHRLSPSQDVAGRVRLLRRAAGDLGPSLVAEALVRRHAFEAAADDLAAGRPALERWLEAMQSPVPERLRSELRARIPAATVSTLAAASRVAREIGRLRLEGAGDLLDAARALPGRLRIASARQLAASEDPRLGLMLVQRAVIRASADLLRQEADRLDVPLSFGALGPLGASWWRGVRRGVPADRRAW